MLDTLGKIALADKASFRPGNCGTSHLRESTSFSTAPLRIWTYVGLAMAGLTFSYASYTVIKTLVNGVDVPGYASLLAAVLFIGSLQLISIGILGEYIGRIYHESKRRPTYVVRKVYETAANKG